MSMERLFLVLAGVFGFLGVALGAFGAHGLKSRLEAAADGAQRLGWWQTGAQYHLVHALALVVAAYLASRQAGTAASVAGFCFAGGIVVFSGSLYAMTLSGVRVLGAVTPFGGLLMLAGWLAVVVAALRLPR
jgi:uncharacterized membrane protein YgdD (TMEM256/DUF423 family)